ncbi:transcriptional regulator [Bacillus mesophilus]|uniref:FMN-binding negative transcriptional regulator n=1 Tax=Bacillus mesophilus TaxID=1808955 RepID=A0A6M0Q713_9BACI|nr:FMN-binding negative transcriptional regulator [Bacillus mesophilus]MBM7661400.1 transcriptional regulator [Bacillus mesophilus]NEY72073.1 FMN-binding negative transcriptional regulator [Bacillus mesophilus]
MYIPKHYKIEDEVSSFDFIKSNSFATLISQHQGEPTATHLPLVLDSEKRILTGHFARSNGQWQDIENQEVLAIFNGPHAYISPSWYETDQAVPTWNYIAVHVYGTIQLVNDDLELLENLGEMTKEFEEPSSPYSINPDNMGFIEGLKRGIVGFKLTIKRVEGKMKMSQNHSEERQKRIIENLEKLSSSQSKQVAVIMKANLDKRRGLS